MSGGPQTSYVEAGQCNVREDALVNDREAVFARRTRERADAYARMLLEVAELAPLVRRDVPEAAALARMWDLTIYALTTAAELAALALALVEHADQRVVWERYLALHLWEGLEALPKLSADLERTVAALGPDADTPVDVEAIRAARKEYGSAVRELRRDRGFLDSLQRIRNGAVAHPISGQGAEIGGLLEWIQRVAAEQASGRSALDGVLLLRSAQYSLAVMQLGYATFKAFNVMDLPPISDASTAT